MTAFRITRGQGSLLTSRREGRLATLELDLLTKVHVLEKLGSHRSE
jgi:hypothetical protein